MLMIPSQVHRQREVLSSAGLFPIITVGAPGTQGVAVAGRQGTGVKTPSLAAVAAMTAGFVGGEHKPEGGMFFIWRKSQLGRRGGYDSRIGWGGTHAEGWNVLDWQKVHDGGRRLTFGKG